MINKFNILSLIILKYDKFIKQAKTIFKAKYKKGHKKIFYSIKLTINKRILIKCFQVHVIMLYDKVEKSK